MLFSVGAYLVASAAAVSATAMPSRRAQSASITPHEQYSSSVGVLGCKINTNRVAYWPQGVDCNNICVKVSYQGRSLNLLKIDQSGGAYDISYDAWNYLAFGKPATQEPHRGGSINMDYEFVPADQCNDLLYDGKLAVSASNSVNYIASCLNDQSSWVANNYEFTNILDPVCHYGWNEQCTLNLAESNQPKCPHQLGDPHSPTGLKVTNIEYGTGREYTA